MLLDRKGSVPLYEQIKNIIEQQIKNGELKEGEKFRPKGNCAKFTMSVELLSDKRLLWLKTKGCFTGPKGWEPSWLSRKLNKN